MRRPTEEDHRRTQEKVETTEKHAVNGFLENSVFGRARGHHLTLTDETNLCSGISDCFYSKGISISDRQRIFSVFGDDLLSPVVYFPNKFYSFKLKCQMHMIIYETTAF